MSRLRGRPPLWFAASVLGVVVVVSGALPAGGALDAVERLAPVLVFLVAVTALAGMADEAGVFEAAAVRAARAGRGRTPVLFALVVTLATATTVLLSLDTTAVLLTPVVLALARRLQLSPLPFALVTVWLANTASLLLPVSNLTNLLATDRLQLSTVAYAEALAGPALVAVLIPVALIAVLDRRLLRGSYAVPTPTPPADRPLFIACVAALTALAVGLVAGLPVAPTTAALAVLLGVVCAVRRPALLRPSLVPWQLVPMVLGLFLTVQAAGTYGLDDVLRACVGDGGALRVAAVGAATSNLLNNLPAFLAIERVVPDDALTALLVGVNLGPLLTPWASLATLLWSDRCRAAGVRVPWSTFTLRGAVLVPLLLLACTAAL